MTNHYLDYLAEREGIQSEECPEGFATYKLNADECYIVDIYVAPEFRRGKVASELADKIAEKARYWGCKFLTGTVSPDAAGGTESLKTLLAYGFKLTGIHPNKNLIIFTKEL